MTLRTIATSVLFLSLVSPLHVSDAQASELSAFVNLCKSNPDCTLGNAYANGGMSFDITRGDGSIRHVYCSPNNQCFEKLPRGRRVALDGRSMELALK
jgi:hypothetical protein